MRREVNIRQHPKALVMAALIASILASAPSIATAGATLIVHNMTDSSIRIHRVTPTSGHLEDDYEQLSPRETRKIPDYLYIYGHRTFSIAFNAHCVSPVPKWYQKDYRTRNNPATGKPQLVLVGYWLEALEVSLHNKDFGMNFMADKPGCGEDQCDLTGSWEGWGGVELKRVKGSTTKYTGSYTDTYEKEKGKKGVITLFDKGPEAGTWKEEDIKREGELAKIEIKSNCNVIEGTYVTTKDGGHPEYLGGGFKWERKKGGGQ